MNDLPKGFEEWNALPGNTGFSMVENTLVTPNEIKAIYKAGMAQGRREQAEKDATLCRTAHIRNNNATSTRIHIEKAIRRAAGEQDD